METFTHIDWISLTHSNLEGDYYPESMNRDYIATKAMNGYTEAKLFRSGVIEMINPKYSKMGVHIIYSGKVLERLENESGIDRSYILAQHIMQGAKLTRLDIAIDVKDSGLNLDSLWQELEGKNAKTKSQHSREQKGCGKGYTVYVGSRKTRRKLVRIYDKATEMGWDNIDYKRIELEMRRDIARNAANSYLKSHFDNEYVKSIINGVVSFPDMPIWHEIMSNESAKIPVAESGNGNTEKWLMRQVAPPMARTLISNPEFAEKFNKQVSFLIEKLLNKE